MKAIYAVFVFFILGFGFEPMLLKTYKGDENLTGWVMSEKLDGVRGLWDKKRLKSRSNLTYNAPKYFIECFGDFLLDGEIYSPDLKFEEISSIVNSYQDKGWHKLKFYVFDLPDESGDLLQRLEVLRRYLKQNPCKYIEIIPQIPALNHENVRRFFKQITQNGGEGVVVRNANAKYEKGRSDNILKFKKFSDDECEIVSYNKGSGKFKDLIGSFNCRNLKDKKVFKIGSGLTDEIRKNPPKIGSIITYKYQGFSSNGLPRFPVFLRVRDDW